MDALLLKGDVDPSTRAVMTAVFLLDRSPNWDLLNDIVGSATWQVPRLRQRVVTPALPVGPPAWASDADVDLRFHLRRVAVGGAGTMDDVLELAAIGATAPFDPARPLWDATLVEGLPDGEAAFILRAHHSIADGLGALQMLLALVDFEETPRARETPVEPGSARPVNPVTLLAGRLVRVPMNAAARSSRALWRAWTPSSALTDPWRTASRGIDYVRSVRRLLRPLASAPSPLLRRRGRSRRFAVLDVPLDQLRSSAKAVGGTLNDAYLAGLLGGMRLYQEASGQDPNDVPMAIPISVRQDGDAADTNRFAAAFIAGPASMGDAAQRMQEISRQVAAARSEPSLQFMESLAPVLQYVPGWLMSPGVVASTQRIDLQASNIPGPADRMYLAGVEIRRLYPFGPAPRVPVMAVLLSYAGVCNIGVVMDADAITDPDVFMSCLRQGFTDVLIVGEGPERISVAR